ncbi:MAG: glutamate racemase [Deltaproteobacteria bacterium]|jgi:glutamate racemase|nr:glutamate racemase [Deltaproteobacteria bacterium]
MIGIFDSGVGGMTVARAVETMIPDLRIIYYGDLARTPYGSKSPETIIEYSVHNTEFLINQGAQVIIIACNSAASVASEVLRQNFNLPIFEVISPAVDRAVTTTHSGNIGVIGTRATIRSEIYDRKIKQVAPELKVFSKACPLLVPLVEEGWTDARETKMILRKYLAPLKQKQIDTLVLGCTHYPLLKDLIQHRMGKNRVRLIDSSVEVALTLQTYLQENPQFYETLQNGDVNRYFVSDTTKAAISTAEKIFGRPIDLIKV